MSTNVGVYACGYADQSHMCRELVRLRGQTPGGVQRSACILEHRRTPKAHDSSCTAPCFAPTGPGFALRSSYPDGIVLRHRLFAVRTDAAACDVAFTPAIRLAAHRGRPQTPFGLFLSSAPSSTVCVL